MQDEYIYKKNETFFIRFPPYFNSVPPRRFYTVIKENRQTTV